MSPQDYFNPKLPFPTLPENLGGRLPSDFTPLQPVKATDTIATSSSYSAELADLRDEVIALQYECESLNNSWVNSLLWTVLLCIISAFAAAYITDELNARWYNARLNQLRPCPTGTIDAGKGCELPRWNKIN